MADEINGNVLLDEIISGDSQKIWSSSSAITRLRDPVALDILSAHLEEIEERTRGIDLGGALYSNNERLKFALHKLDYYRSKAGCLCRLYPEYLMYDPKQEEADGNIRILANRKENGGWTIYFTGECTICGAHYQIEQGEYHYTWWKWQIVS